MFNVIFRIENPWADKFKNIYHATGKTFLKNKFWEFEVLKTTDLIYFEFLFNRHTDHAGVRLEVGLFGYNIMLSAYDNRHWNYEKGEWK